MSVYPGEGLRAMGSTRRIRALERASRADPGSYRIHMRVATAQAERGNCRSARKHAEAARYLYPRAPEPRRGHEPGDCRKLRPGDDARTLYGDLRTVLGDSLNDRPRRSRLYSG